MKKTLSFLGLSFGDFISYYSIQPAYNNHHNLDINTQCEYLSISIRITYK